MQTQDDDQTETALTMAEIEAIFDDLSSADFSDTDDMIDKDAIASRVDAIEKAFDDAGLDITITARAEGSHRLEPTTWPDAAPQNAWDAWDELQALRPFVEDRYIDGPFIHESHWVTYAQQLCEDIGEAKIPDYIVIDWEATAANLLQDYTTFEMGAETFYAR